mgnify:CR=1 FL=1
MIGYDCPMTKTLIPIVIACSQRKRKSDLPSIKLETVINGDDLAQIADSWLESLNCYESKLSAVDTYVGGEWPSVRELAKKGFPVYVCSAGYGLLASSDLVARYDATFSKQVSNSVVKALSAQQKVSDWVDVISNKRIQQGAPSFDQLFGQNKTVVVSLSAPYLEAFWPSIFSASNKYKDCEVLLFCPSVFKPCETSALNLNIFHLDERWRTFLKCTRSTLATTAAIYLISSFPVLNREAVCEFDSSLPSVPRAKAKKKFENDEALQDVLRQGWSSGLIPRQTTKALAYVRNTLGWACEQSRFARIVRDLKASEDLYGEG